MSRIWVIFYLRNLKGEPVDMLGSDGTQPLDGRATINTAKVSALLRAEKLLKHKPVCGYRLHRGTLPSNLIPIAPYQSLGVN